MSVAFAVLRIGDYIFDSADSRILSEAGQNQCPNTISCFKWQSPRGTGHMEQLQITGNVVLGLGGKRG